MIFHENMSHAFHENLCIYNSKLHVFPFSSFSIQISIKTSSWVYEHFHHLLTLRGRENCCICYVVFISLSSVVERKWKFVVFVWMGKMATHWIDTENKFNDWLLERTSYFQGFRDGKIVEFSTVVFLKVNFDIQSSNFHA